MDLTQLEQQLKDALANVINEEAVLNQAIDAVKAVLPNVPVDAAWAAVQVALTANGWTAPAQPATPGTPAPNV